MTPPAAMTAPTAPLLWEQHCCLPLTTDADLGELARYQRPGGAFVSVNIASGPTDPDQALAVARHFLAGIARQPALTLAGTVAEIGAALAAGTVAVAFDLEDSSPLGGNLDQVQAYYDLGVRTLLPTYNRRNQAGCGCLDTDDTGLTAYGHDLVRQLNAVGMVPDGAHCSARSGLDISDRTAKPMVYSHAAMRSLHPHPRNITDDQAEACAATGGVIGVTGVRHMLGERDGTLLDGVLRHVRYLLDLVGPDHVGLATDYVFDQASLFAHIAANPALYPEVDPPRGPDSYMAPEELLGAPAALATLGLSDAEVAGILGGNFARVAAASWTSAVAR
jgi:membrane dipeptidase